MDEWLKNLKFSHEAKKAIKTWMQTSNLTEVHVHPENFRLQQIAEYVAVHGEKWCCRVLSAQKTRSPAMLLCAAEKILIEQNAEEAAFDYDRADRIADELKRRQRERDA